MTTRIHAANARRAEASRAFEEGRFADAARDYTLAAEQFEAIWWEMHGERGTSPDAQNMRRAASEAAARRDADRPRIKLEGRIGGFQD